MDDDLTVTGSVRIPRHELQVSFSASGGPGGQHAKKSATRVDLRFDIANSSAFSEAQRARVIERMGDELRVVVDDERSQLRNRALAEERLVARLQSALHANTFRLSFSQASMEDIESAVEKLGLLIKEKLIK